MKQLKKMLMNLVTSFVFVTAITTVASTSRVLAYQPEMDGEVMKKYLNK